MRNLGPVEDLIEVTPGRDPITTQPIEQQDHSVLGVEAPWWLHAWLAYYRIIFYHSSPFDQMGHPFYEKMGAGFSTY